MFFPILGMVLSTASAGDFYVPSEYATVGDAAAVVSDGDTIIIEQGAPTTGYALIDNSITIKPANDMVGSYPSVPILILDGTGQDVSVRIEQVTLACPLTSGALTGAGLRLTGDPDHGLGLLGSCSGTCWSDVTAVDVKAPSGCGTADPIITFTNGFLEIQDSTLEMEGPMVTDGTRVAVRNSTLSPAGAGYPAIDQVAGTNQPGRLTVDGSTLSGFSHSGDGGAVRSDAEAITISNSLFENNSAGRGGALWSSNGGGGYGHIITESTFRGNSATSTNGAVRLGGSAAIVDITVEGTTKGPAFSVPGGTLRRSFFCGNDAAGTSIAHLSTGGQVQGTLFANGSSGAAVSTWGTGLENVTVIGQTGNGVEVDNNSTTPSLINTLVAHVSGIGVVPASGTAVAGGSKNAVFAAGGGVSNSVTGTWDDDLVTVDPMFQGYTGTEACDTLVAWLDPESPLRRAGNATIHNLDDPGGDYPADIGAYGGPWADLVDADGDNSYEDVDCNESDPSIYYGAPEIADDGIDQDCNGADTISCFQDGDGDGYGSTTTALASDGSCDLADGESDNDEDCNDSDPTVNPGAQDVCDGDGSVGAQIDQDCNSLTAPSFTDYYPDGDEDGHGATGSSATLWCADPGVGWSLTASDCNDADASVNPDAAEVCDGAGSVGEQIDQDCNSLTSPTFTTYYVDADGDDHGLVGGSGTDYCADPGAGWAVTADDCNDADGSVHPGATEVCDGDGTAGAQVDTDCDSTTEPVFTDYFVDGDGDGFGGAGGTATAYCADPGAGWSATSDDCDDGSTAINPDAAEVWYDGVDQDCSGGSDYDQDGDGHDSDAHGGDDCMDDPAGIGGVAGANIYPGATDTWYDGVDADCAGNDDADQDGDGYAWDGLLGDDCDDQDPDIHPDAVDDTVDGVDQDCDGTDAGEELPGDSGDTGLVDTGPLGTDDDDEGCNCSSTRAGGVAWLLLGLLPLVRRRR